MSTSPAIQAKAASFQAKSTNRSRYFYMKFSRAMSLSPLPLLGLLFKLLSHLVISLKRKGKIVHNRKIIVIFVPTFMIVCIVVNFLSVLI